MSFFNFELFEVLIFFKFSQITSEFTICLKMAQINKKNWPYS